MLGIELQERANKEREQEVRVFRVVAICDECGLDVEVFEPEHPMVSYQVGFHSCSGCGKGYRFKTTYPRIDFRSIESQENAK